VFVHAPDPPLGELQAKTKTKTQIQTKTKTQTKTKIAPKTKTILFFLYGLLISDSLFTTTLSCYFHQSILLCHMVISCSARLNALSG
jgi:hypothetical protein